MPRRPCPCRLRLRLQRWAEAAAAYETAGDMDSVVRLSLEKLGAPQRAYAIVRKTQHRLTGRNHLTHFGIYGRDHARMAGHQTCVAGLVALRLRLGLGLTQGGIGRFEGRLAPFQIGTTDEVLRLQGFKTLELSHGQIALALRRAHLSQGRLRGQLVILRVNSGKQLPSRYALSQID